MSSTSDTEVSPIGHELSERQKEQLANSLSMALACNIGEFSPLRNEVNRIKQLRFSTSARNIINGSRTEPILSREDFRDSIVDPCALSPP